LASEEGSAEELRWRLPDLVIIDGGKGQVSAGRGVLDALGLHDLPLAGLAKEREELFLPGRSDPIVLPATSAALYLVQRLRDEAHRFAITYHRKVRAAAQTRSALDDLPGVGPARKRALLRVFGSTKALRQASADEIAAVPGISRGLADRIREHLNA
jgi:excinuclease ABC subunit C